MGTKDKFDFLSMAIIKEMSSSLGWGRVEGCEKLDGSEDRAQKLKMTLSLVSVCHSPPTLCHPSKERWLSLCARKIRLDTTVEDDAEKVNLVSRIKEISSY